MYANLNFILQNNCCGAIVKNVNSYWAEKAWILPRMKSLLAGASDMAVEGQRWLSQLEWGIPISSHINTVLTVY